MNRSFNTIGTCRPDTDYMVDISERVERIKEMVDNGLYFTINRPRQYGKTTVISALARRLSNEYICIRISFEGFGEKNFENETAFCFAFMGEIQTALKRSPDGYDSSYANSWENSEVKDFFLLDRHITKMCQGKRVVLLIDEVDKSSDNKVFLHFLGVLRKKYLLRKEGMDDTFQSVILTGVYDIRNIKLKIINENTHNSSGLGHLLNSPWNIAADFLVDMSFSPVDIEIMLAGYEADYSTGMDTRKVSEAIFEYTGGYPFLVSKICQMLDKDKPLSQDWTPRGIRSAVKLLIHQSKTIYGQSNTLFDDITKNLENYPDLYSFVYDVLIFGKQLDFNLDVPTIQLAAMFGLVKEKDGAAAISNRIFEIVLSNYFIAKDAVNRNRKHIIGYRGDVILNNRFDMECCLKKFAALFREVFTDKDAPFIEEHGRMLFLTYLKPLINGGGFYHIESQLTDQRRMDLVVDFGLDQFIIELKLWYGESAHENAYNQLAGYLKSKRAQDGYLLTFDFRKRKNRSPRAQWVEWDGVRIFDVIF